MTGSPRQYGYAASLSFVIGTVIGTGIYLKPGLVARLMPETWQSILLWLLGGAFALSGALVYAKLADIWPSSGGAYVYIKHCYGDWAASLLLAADLLLARPAAVGALATGLGLVWELSLRGTIVLAAGVIIGLTLTQLAGRKTVGGIQVFLTILKLLPLLLILVAGTYQHPAPLAQSVSSSSPQWAAGFLAVVWAYDGWYNVTVLGGEVRNPRIAIYRSLVWGVGTIILIYVVLNYVLLLKIDRATIISQGVPFLALLKGTTLAPLAAIIRWCLSIAILATLNAVLACGPSMISAGGLDGENDLRDTRKASIMFSGWCLLILVIFSLQPSQFALFDRLSEYTAFVVSGLSGLTVSCLFVLPSLGYEVDRTSRCAAVFFLLLDVLLMFLLFSERPIFAVIGIISVFGSGTALEAIRRRL